MPRWNCEFTFVKDFNGRIIANIEEKTTVKEPAVKLSSAINGVVAK